MGQPTPESLAKAGSEHAHQCALFCWAALPHIQALYPMLKWLFAIPNGGERNSKVAAQLKAEGVRAGVLDVFLPYPSQGHHGLFVEMKIKPNSASDKQIEFARHVVGMGYYCALCYSWEEARDVIIYYITGVKP